MSECFSDLNGTLKVTRTLSTIGQKLGVINMLGRTFMGPQVDNPFLLVEAELAKLKAEGAECILIDFHAEATSEKIAFGRAVDGLATLVVGTHTHVPTADGRVITRVNVLDRATHPVWFWIIYAFWFVPGALIAWGGVTFLFTSGQVCPAWGF